uniref:Galectin n=1 Tax=Oncorhynchus tshawytscha TaxID=74940 RepID=A0AAZ3QHE3_ONCTS
MTFRVENMSFKQGQEMTFTGKTKSGASNFTINIGHDSDNYALHFNPRFNHGHIVCNSLSGGSWGDELKEGHFPFQDGEQFKVCVCVCVCSRVCVCDKVIITSLTFHHRSVWSHSLTLTANIMCNRFRVHS